MWVNKIKRKKLQMTLIGLVVLFSSFLLSSSIGIIANISNPINNIIKETKAPILYFIADGTINTKNEFQIAKSILEKNSDVKEVRVIDKCKNVQLTGNIKDKNISEPWIFLTYKDGDFGNIKFLNGGSVLKKGECYINSWMADMYKINIDDEINLNSMGKPISLKVKGVYSEPYSLSPGLGYVRCYVSEAELNELNGSNKTFINVYAKEGAKSKNIIKTYMQKHINKFSYNVIDIETAKLSVELAQEIAAGFIAGFSIIILIVSAMVIRASIIDNLIKEFKTIGVYKSMGYSQKSINGIYIKAYSLVIFISALIGAAFSSFLVKYILEDNFKVIGNIGSIDMGMPVLITVVLVMIIMILSIHSAVKRTKKITPVEAFSLSMPKGNTKAKSISFIEDKCSPIYLALRKMLSFKKFTVILFLIFFICSYVIAYSVTSYMNLSDFAGKSSYWFGLDNGSYRGIIKDKEKVDTIYEYIKSRNETRNVVKGTIMYGGVTVSKELMDGNLVVQTTLYEEFDNGLKEEMIEGRNPKNKNEIALSKMFLKKINKSIGDYIEIYIKGEKNNLLITGSYQSMIEMGINARLLEETVKSSDKDYRSENISFNLKNDKDYEAFKEEVKKELNGSVEIIKSSEYQKEALKSVMDSSKTSIAPFMIMVVIFASINVFCLIMLMNINSRRSFTIYRTIGYSANDIIRQNELYILILGTLASLVCIPVFNIVYGRIMNLLFKNFGIYNYPAEINQVVLLISMLLAVVFYVLSARISSQSINKIRIQELNEE